MTPFRPARAILELGPDFWDPVQAAVFPLHRLRFRNDRAAATVGLDRLPEEIWIEHFGRFRPLDGSLAEPLALRYHGHQFRVYNPEIGDGRGFLFAQLRDDRGRLLDLGTKGSGQTPYSRFGDGRLTLKGGVREVLATEMLEALGVDTSKTFSLIETGEALQRGDEPSPTRSAVLVRLSHSHVRYGTFQRLAALGEAENMRRLVDYALRWYFTDAPRAAPVEALIDRVTTLAARQAAAFIVAGFVHGVLNTDNINITGESFDYGPWRFAPAFDAGFTAAYFDHAGLYSFGRQPEALHWNLYQLANALRLIAPVEALKPSLESFGARYRAELGAAATQRLGVRPRGEPHDAALVEAIEAGLAASGLAPDRLWFDWRGGRLRASTAVYDGPAFNAFRAAIGSYASAGDDDHPYWADPEPCTMLIDEVEAIWASIAAADDWSAFDAKIAAVRRMGAALAGRP